MRNMTRQSRAHVLALLVHEPVAQPRLAARALAQALRPVLVRRRQDAVAVRLDCGVRRRRARPRTAFPPRLPRRPAPAWDGFPPSPTRTRGASACANFISRA